MSFTNTEKYKDWLERVSLFYQLPKEDIIGNSRYNNCCEARNMFYKLCYRDKIDIYHLSVTLGKCRTVIMHNLKRSNFKSRETEDILWKQIR